MEPQEYQKVYYLEDNYWWFKAKRYLLVNTLRRLLNGLSRDRRLLDGGCGTGANLVEISRFLPVIGVEKYFGALEFCKKRGLRNLINARLEELPFRQKTFDIVFLMDILEHVDSDVEVIKELSRVSKEGTTLIIHVPAFKSLWSDHDVAVGHKRRYIAGELVKQLQETNFTVKSINYRLCIFFPLGLLRKYLIRIKKILVKDYGVRTYRPNFGKVINKLLYNFIKFEDYLLNYIHLPFGLSIFCIAQKK